MRRNGCTQTPGAMGILLSLRSDYPGWCKTAGNLFLEPIFPAVYFFTVSLPFCGRRGKGLPRTGQNVQSFAKPRLAWLGFTTTYKTAGTAKLRGSHIRRRFLWVGLWVGKSPRTAKRPPTFIS